MANITRMNVMIMGNAKGLINTLSASQKAILRFSRSANKSLAAMSASFKPIGGSLATGFKRFTVGATAAGLALTYLTKKSIDAVGDTNDFAKALGLTYNRLRKVQFAAAQAGVAPEQLNAAFAKMSDTLGTAFGGNEAAIETFTKLGLSMDALKNMSPGQQFEAIAQAINKIEDPSEKMAAARDIFGKSGGNLISLFENAGAAIFQAGQVLEWFGGQLTQIEVEKIDNAGDALAKLGLYAEGAGNRLAANFSPYITAAVEALINWTAAAGGVGPAMDALIGGALDKMDSLLNKISAAQEAYNKFSSYLTGGVGFIADKVADASESLGIGKAQRAFDEQKRLEAIPEHRRAEAKRLLDERGGFAGERVTDRMIANEMNISSRQYKSRADVIDQSAMGNQFRDWRAGVDNKDEQARLSKIAADEYAAKYNNAPGRPRNFVERNGIPGQSAMGIADPIEYKKHVDGGYKSKIPNGDIAPSYKSKIPTRDNYLSKVPVGNNYESKIPQGIPDYVSKMAPGMNQPKSMGDGEDINLLRQIAVNTGKNTIAFAG